MNTFNLKMNTKAPVCQGILVPKAGQFQKQFSICIKMLPRYLQTWSKWEADDLVQVLIPRCTWVAKSTDKIRTWCVLSSHNSVSKLYVKKSEAGLCSLRDRLLSVPELVCLDIYLNIYLAVCNVKTLACGRGANLTTLWTELCIF